MSHPPNPYDFVPFGDKPNLFKYEDLTSGELYEGYIELYIQALTPVHIVGQQIPESEKRIKESKFYREDNKAIIPSSTIRGMLRSFIEAVTDGWLGKYNQTYEKIKGSRKTKGRHKGYNVFDSYTIKIGDRIWKNENYALSKKYRPKRPLNQDPFNEWELDISTFLFGQIFEKEDDNNDAFSLKGRISIEDASINVENLSSKYFLPDIEGKSYLGGPSPSMSNWWYFTPKDIEYRTVDRKEFAEFIGNKYRGRKFYYHQDHNKCLEWYQNNWRKLHYNDRRNERINSDELPIIYKYKVEAMIENSKSDVFRIYFDGISNQLLNLITYSLALPLNIYHKIGFGKPFGFGSVKFSVEEIRYRKYNSINEIKIFENNNNNNIDKKSMHYWGNSVNNIIKNKTIICQKCQEALFKIMNFKKGMNILFTYPPYNKEYFQQGIFMRIIDNIVDELVANKEINDPSSMNLNEINKIIDKLYSNNKKTIDFKFYQTKSKGYFGPQ